MTKIELLAPAKDSECGIAAINCGADAVYIGAQRFGARENAANRLEDIARLVEHAHRYWARVYVTVNTLLKEQELPQAVRLIHELHEIGVDGLIIQDMGLLECSLPPLPLIASTQMHNDSPEKVAFLEHVGFQRVILARELSLNEIRVIRKAAPRIELECFIHGALCVSYSGQCYLSYALGGRSGNRGQCAQPCRKVYDLMEGGSRERTVARGRHLLSIRDLNLTGHLADLLEAGITSFKIEGRLKDKAYVVNVVAHYRQQLDRLLGHQGRHRSSSGVSHIDFTPDPAKTFNRGFTSYFIEGRREAIGAHDTPKMAGEFIGTVTAAGKRTVRLDRMEAALRPGDGLAFFGPDGVLTGTSVNGVKGLEIALERPSGIHKGTRLFRNYDHAFITRLNKSRAARRIAVSLTLRASADGLVLVAQDEDGNRAECEAACDCEPAEKPEVALATIEKQLRKMGGTFYECREVSLDLSEPPFIPVALLNSLRREALEGLTAAREAKRPRGEGHVVEDDFPYPEGHLSYRGNVLNPSAERFYERHGVESIEPAAESGSDMRGREVMVTRYCLKHELGLCPKHPLPGQDRKKAPPADSGGGPLFLVDEEGHRLELRFNCAKCRMYVFLAAAPKRLRP